jgi:hypothetical protein
MRIPIIATALLLSVSTAEERFPHKRDDAIVEEARIHARDFATALYKPSLAVRSDPRTRPSPRMR